MWQRRQKPPDWDEQFVIVMRAVTKDDTLTFEAGARILQEGSASLLLRFDDYSRKYWWYLNAGVPERAQAMLKHALGRPEHAELYLFHEACNDNGYIRERALRALRGHTGRLACAAPLLRAGDWVPQVSELAQKLIADFASTARAQYFFDFLELILALRRRSRFERTWDVLEQALLEPQWREQRLHAVEQSCGEVRRFALEMVLKVDTEISTDSLALAAADPSPIVSSWALITASRSLPGDQLRPVLEAGLRNRMAFVRADALRRYSRAGFPDGRERAAQAALDRSQTVRRSAYHLLSKEFGESALFIWREKFDSGAMRDLLIASLAEYGEREDEGRFRSQLTAKRARTRASALRGLWRLDVPDLAQLLDNALHDPAPLMVSVAASIYSKSNELPTREQLESALSRTNAILLRARLLSAGRLLPKWEHLRYLLTQYPQRQADHSALLEHELSRWLWKSNRRFTPPTSEQQAVIRAALAALRRERPLRVLESIAAHC